MKSWGSQADLADEFERELSLSHESAKNESEPLDYDDVISLTSSDPAASALLGYAQEEQEMSESEDGWEGMEKAVFCSHPQVPA